MAQKAKYESKSVKSSMKVRPMVKQKKEIPKLSAFAQEFHPTEHVLSESLEFQDFPLPSDDYMPYDYNPYLASEQEYAVEYESDRKPQKESDKLEGMDFSTFVVFSNVKNVPLEITLAEPGDGPARLRLCTFGYNCIRKTFDCPYTHIPNDEGNWHHQDENVPTPRDECDESDTQVTRKVHQKSTSKIGLSKTSQLPTSISFVSTTSITSTASTTSDDSVDSSDHSPSITPPDSPSASSSYSSSPDSPDGRRQGRKIKLVPTGASSKSTVGTRKATDNSSR